MIIGLSGYARSGKDTVAQVLVEKYGFQRIAFADKIREFLYDLNPRLDHTLKDSLRLRDIVDVNGWEKAKIHKVVREYLQDIGVSARNVFGEEFWIKQALASMHTGNVVITDVRFPNEARVIKKLDGELWRVIRPGILPINDHISEHALDGWEFDFDIYNDSDVNNLTNDIHILMEDEHVF
mgnify:CR=1 FL=1